MIEVGELFTFGWAEHGRKKKFEIVESWELEIVCLGQLGLGRIQVQNVFIPQLVDQLPRTSPVVQVSCGGYHTLGK